MWGRQPCHLSALYKLSPQPQKNMSMDHNESKIPNRSNLGEPGSKSFSHSRKTTNIRVGYLLEFWLRMTGYICLGRRSRIWLFGYLGWGWLGKPFAPGHQGEMKLSWWWVSVYKKLSWVPKWWLDLRYFLRLAGCRQRDRADFMWGSVRKDWLGLVFSACSFLLFWSSSSSQIYKYIYRSDILWPLLSCSRITPHRAARCPYSKKESLDENMAEELILLSTVFSLRNFISWWREVMGVVASPFDSSNLQRCRLGCFGLCRRSNWYNSGYCLRVSLVMLLTTLCCWYWIEENGFQGGGSSPVLRKITPDLQ